MCVVDKSAGCLCRVLVGCEVYHSFKVGNELQYISYIQGMSSLRSLIPFTPAGPTCLKHQLITIYLGFIVVWSFIP